MRHGNVRSTYSSEEEEKFNSDDSVDVAPDKLRFGAVNNQFETYKYVDAMTNRNNETDRRLLRASINN